MNQISSPSARSGPSPIWRSNLDYYWSTQAERRTVLVVDDDQRLLRLLNIVLAPHFDVITAPGGKDALEEVERRQPDLIVLDLFMPEMDGRKVYRELRSRSFTNPVLILSAYGAADAQAELGADAYLSKPFDPEDLVVAIEGLLASS